MLLIFRKLGLTHVIILIGHSRMVRTGQIYGNKNIRLKPLSACGDLLLTWLSGWRNVDWCTTFPSD